MRLYRSIVIIMEKLIPLINSLQDVLGAIHTKLDISLPQIVVVGSQSSGKSSVLESIVGKDFLPRGSGIVTRRPLILQLIHTPGKEEWGEFSHIPAKKFHDFEKIRREIEEETERLLGKKANISSKNIFLRIHSPQVLDITLVDLPGLTKVPVGDQPADIESQIREMILSFITNPNSIVLAISNANQDLANSESLKLAREVDPSGERTIGVITKIDLMDKGTDAMDMLKGRLYPLKLGYVGVMCRSQLDINNNKSISKHLEDEKKFFSTHEKYRQISHTMGIPYLSWKLNKILMMHIKNVLPDLKKKINEALRSNEEKLRTYGYPLDGNRDFQGMIMLNIIITYSTNFSNTIEGRTISDIFCELEGGAKIRDILLQRFINTLKNIDPLDGVEDSEIQFAIASATGIKTSLLIPELAFEMLLKTQIKRLLDPSITVMREVYEQLKTLSADIKISESDRFPKLQPAILMIVDKVLDECVKSTNDFIVDFIEIQLAYINTYNTDCIPIRKALENAENEIDGKPRNSLDIIDKTKILGSWGENKVEEISDEERNELIQISTIKNLLQSYFSVIKKTVGDYIPKAIMSFLVIKSKEKIQTELISQLYNKDKFDEIFIESSDIPYKRKALEELQTGLQAASRILSQVRDFDLDSY